MTADILREALHAIAFDGPHSAGPIGRRDYAILLLGFAGAFRRSELAALTVKDVTVTSGALHIQIRRSKTDQEGHGQMKALPIGKDPTTCPPCAYFRWIEQIVVRATATSKSSRVLDWAFHQHACDERNDETALLRPDQPLFPALRKGGQLMDHAVSGGTINNVVKKRLAAIGLDASQYGGHSLRSGFVTQAFRAGATHHEVMRQTGHRDPTTVEIYSREYEPLRQNAVLRLGL